jgi:Zn-dependent M16 (insulinase) family peptidase
LSPRALAAAALSRATSLRHEQQTASVSILAMKHSHGNDAVASTMLTAKTATALGFERLPTFAEGKDVRESRGSEHGVLGANGIQAWRHRASGIRLVKFNAPGPLVSLSIFVGTEPVSNAGEPHTLEHLVFMSSKRHPQRGFLDTCAGLALCSGTNAFTANEYTAYTATTAGVEGFVTLLPCYLDHVLRPCLSEGDFASEVYRVKSDGTECGVVFSEMQSREHTEGDVMDREVRKALLAGTPLALEAGGLCDAIRNLTNADVRNFHAKHYCGANVSLAIGGSSDVPIESFLKAIAPLLDEISAEPGYDPGQIAWQELLSLQPMILPVERRFVRFPCADEDIGSVIIGWRGPPCQESYRNLALNILLRYLTANTAAFLKQRFVMLEDPLCSDIYSDVETYRHVSTVTLVCQGVSHLEECDGSESGGVGGTSDEEDTACDEETKTKADQEDVDEHAAEGFYKDESLLESGRVANMVMEALEEIVKAGKLPGGVLSVRASISQQREEFLSDLEEDAHETIANSLVEELIYGDALGVLIGDEARGELSRLKHLESKDEEWWLQLLNDALVCSPRVELFMVPDRGLAAAHAAKEEQMRQDRLGAMANGNLQVLQRRSDDLLSAIKPCVDFTTASFSSRPSTENIPRLSYNVTVSSPGALPWHGLSIAVDTSLVLTTIYFSTSSLSFEQKMCLPLLAELLLKLDLLLDDGTRVPYTESSQAISEATVDTETSGTLLGGPSRMRNECFGITYAAKPGQAFDNATDLVLRALFHGVVTGERISSASKNAVADLIECLRDGATVLDGAINMVPTLMADKSDAISLPNVVITSLFGKQEFMHFVADEYSREKPRLRTRRKLVKLVTSALQSLRAEASVFVQVTARDPGVAHDVICRHWTHCWRSEGSENFAPSSPILRKPAVLQTMSRSIGSRAGGRAIGIQGVEGCFLDVRVDSDAVPGHVDWAPLQVLSQLLSRCEGPLYTAVRGSGFAYGVNLGVDPWMRTLYLGIHDASLPVSAWSAVCASLVRFRAALDAEDSRAALALDLNTAKSMTLFDLVESRSTPSQIAAGVFAGCVQNLPAGELADLTLEDEVERVDLTAIQRAYDAHVVRLLKPASRLALLACGSSVLDKNIADFSCLCDYPIMLVSCDVADLALPQASRMVAAMSKNSR